MKLWVLNADESGLAFDIASGKDEVKVVVDNQQLEDTDYTADEGKVVLNPEFLNSLEVGFHTVEVNGASEKFVVAAADPMFWAKGSAESLAFESIQAADGIELSVSDGGKLVDQKLTAETDYTAKDGIIVLSPEFLNTLEAGYCVIKTGDGYAEVFQII